MDEITREYLTLFNAVTDAARTLEDLRQRLLLAQQKAEALYVMRGEEREEG